MGPYVKKLVTRRMSTLMIPKDAYVQMLDGSVHHGAEAILFHGEIG